MQTVNLPNGDKAQFPDTMPKEQIESVLSQHLSNNTTNSSTITAKSSDQISPVSLKSSTDTLPAPLGTAFAISSNYLKGINYAVNQTGSLANTILKSTLNKIYGQGNSATKGLDMLGNKANEISQEFDNWLSPRTLAEQNAIDQSTVAGPLAQTIGYMGGAGAIQGKVLSPVSNIMEKAITPILPAGLAGSSLVKGAISQGTLGAGLGAAATPDQPLQGAIQGAKVGAVLGAVAGPIGAKLARGNAILDFEKQNMINSGINPDSIEGVTRQIKALKDNGVSMSTVLLKKQISNQIADKIQSAGPLTNLNQTPVETISELATKRYADLQSQMKTLTAPLDQLKSTFNTDQFTTTKAQVTSDIASKQLRNAIPLIPDNASFTQMWQTRQKLDIILSTARIQAANGKILKTDLVPLNQMRDALTQDMNKAATDSGLGQNFQDANNLYKQNILPFQAFRTTSGKLISPEDVQESMKRINTLLNPKISPDYKSLNKVADSLGPDGKEIVGQSILQNMVLKSQDQHGNIDPQQFFSKMKKATSAGMDNILWSKNTRDAAKGIQKILEGSKETTSLGTINDPSMLSKLIPSLMGNRIGMILLRTIGNSNTPGQISRELLQKVLTARFAQGAALNAQTNQ